MPPQQPEEPVPGLRRIGDMPPQAPQATVPGLQGLAGCEVAVTFQMK